MTDKSYDKNNKHDVIARMIEFVLLWLFAALVLMVLLPEIGLAAIGYFASLSLTFMIYALYQVLRRMDYLWPLGESLIVTLVRTGKNDGKV